MTVVFLIAFAGTCPLLAMSLWRAGAVLGRPSVPRWPDRVSGMILIGLGVRTAVEAR
ncbi:hypothetical protein [Microbispora sp. ATCC PTA-5024]|uniref:hypothetical protein n=1 Tax=Microbispora sp. ATCC PTA-5024 TaxID=316330 RepID=UPI0003DDF065|nr:hypothetical protein [Microbispora sp. ATCC PTA-5024]ETK37909.1 hypothetical protein MPTA5024_01485 [Microbispora sp. ATCC PTA-5024]